jgi:ferrochelatase
MSNSSKNSSAGDNILVLVQLGSPEAPTAGKLRPYLKKFLSDPRVIDLPKLLWWPILNLFILPFRPRKSAEAYKRIWTAEGSPLVTGTEKLARLLQLELKDTAIVKTAYIIGRPDFTHMLEEIKPLDQKRLTIVPLFPQYSESTSASVFDISVHALQKQVVIPEFSFVNQLHSSRAFIDQGAQLIGETLTKRTDVPDLVISFHGIPKRRVTEKKDPYFRHCLETYLLLQESFERQFPNLKVKFHMTFQSRFGSEEWLNPYTDLYIEHLVEQGHKKIAVYCPSFLIDCLETSDEIGNELGDEVKEMGGELVLVPCLNDRGPWVKQWATELRHKIENESLYREDLYSVEKHQIKIKEGVRMLGKSEALPPESKSVLKIVFLTLFLDLVGFSIIFPLFPALARHYMEVDSDNIFLRGILNAIASFAGSSETGELSTRSIVLFGGALGALYSFLQFLAAPLWGSLSDRYGRRPILLISVFSLAISYLLWFFSGSFTLLVIARIVGGIMGGNISTATAVVADVTRPEQRAKGMAVVGIAFALGFIIGPAMGGIMSLWNMAEAFPALAAFGVNPFSSAALLAFLLSAINFVWLWKSFKETLPPSERAVKKEASERTMNPFVLFKPLPYKGANLINFAHFFFLLAFSGMEFTLTFLAVERFGFTSLNNGLMFIYIGFVLVMIQGGVVRRKAASVGEAKMAMTGLIVSMPGLLLLGWTQTTGLFYVGLTFLAIGSAMVIPCMTTLASRYLPKQEQGRGLGVFRSLGALARVFGPISASIIFWHWGSAYPYYLGAAFLVIPFLMSLLLPAVPKTEEG